MAVFKSSRVFESAATDLESAGSVVAERFTAMGYEAQVEPTLDGCLVSVSKGGMFKAVCGLKSALNIEIGRLSPSRVQAVAGVGVFGMQVAPTLVACFITWPVLITQIWGLVRQSKLDDQAMDFIQAALEARSPAIPAVPAAARYCVECGASLTATARFCSECGAQVEG